MAPASSSTTQAEVSCSWNAPLCGAGVLTGPPKSTVSSWSAASATRPFGGINAVETADRPRLNNPRLGRSPVAQRSEVMKQIKTVGISLWLVLVGAVSLAAQAPEAKPLVITARNLTADSVKAAGAQRTDLAMARPGD